MQKNLTFALISSLIALAGFSAFSSHAQPTPVAITASTDMQTQKATVEQRLKQKNIPMQRLEFTDYAGFFQIFYEDQTAYVDYSGQYLILGDVHLVEDILKNVPSEVDTSFKKVAVLPHSQVSYAKFLNELVYLTQDQRHVFVGNLVRIDDMTDITEELVFNIDTVDWQQLPFQQALKFTKGQGTRELAIFSDPLCPFCRQLEKNLQQLDNITIYTFIIPFKPNAMSVAERIWCDKNPQYTWNNLMLKGKMPTSTTHCKTPFEQNLNLAETYNINATPTIVLPNGVKLAGALSAKELEEILQLATP